MADVTIPGLTTQLTSVDRAADLLEVSDTSDSGNSKKSSVNNLLDLTSHPVGIDDVQTLTNKTITAPTVSSPVLSGTVTGMYTLGGTPTFPSAVVTLTGSQTLTNKVLTSPTINAPTITNPTITVDTISEFTSANGVTIDGLNIKDSALNTSNSVPNNALSNTGSFGSAWAWADWTPTIANVTGGTLNYAKFIRVGKQVTARFSYTLAGAGVSGDIGCSLPVTAAANYVSASIMGFGAFLDANSTDFWAVPQFDTTTNMVIRYISGGGFTSASSTAPFTWASGDRITFTIVYEAA